MIPLGVSTFIQTSRSPQIICVARNYADHCKELNNAIPKRPNFFFKSSSSLIFPPETILVPEEIKDGVHYEAEVAVIIGKKGSNIPVGNVSEYIAGITAALDITAREVQENEKSKSLSWTLSKALSTFCPMCPDMLKINDVDALKNIDIRFTQNGAVRQNGNTKDMIFDIPILISYLSSLVTLSPGDIILTGTPAGVGPVAIGDKLEVSITSPEGSGVNATFLVSQKPPRPAGVAFFPFSV